MKENKDKLYLHHILDAIKKIEKYTRDKSFDNLKASDLLYDAVLREIEIIGEASRNLSDNFKEQHADLPLHQAMGMRNQLIHGYFNIRPEIVWQTCQEDIPKLKKQIEKLIS